MVALLASCAGRYCRLAMTQQATNADDVAEPFRLRLLVRQMMADWFLLAAARVTVAEIRPDGLDADIAGLCGLAPRDA